MNIQILAYSFASSIVILIFVASILVGLIGSPIAAGVGLVRSDTDPGRARGWHPIYAFMAAAWRWLALVALAAGIACIFLAGETAIGFLVFCVSMATNLICYAAWAIAKGFREAFETKIGLADA